MKKNINNNPIHWENVYFNFYGNEIHWNQFWSTANKASKFSLLHFCDRFHALFSWQPSAWESSIMQIKTQMAATEGKYNTLLLNILVI